MLFSARRGVLLLALTSPFCLVADGVVSTNTCTFRSFVPPEITITRTGSESCVLQRPEIPVGGARASTDISVNLPVAGQPATPVVGKIAENVGAAVDIGQNGIAEAFGSIDYSFTTAGPARSGFLLLLDPGSPGRVIFGLGPDGVQIASAHIGIGPLGESCGGTRAGATCFGTLASAATRFPFSLGQDFQFQEDVHMQASSTFFEIQDGFGIVNFPFMLLESDGATPVQIELTAPEPGSQILAAFGLLTLLTLIPRSSYRGE